MAALTIQEAREALLADGVNEHTVRLFLENFQANPKVWRNFERFALDAIAVNHRLGAKAIMERVRWEVEIEHGGDFKVSNSFTAYYGRIFALKHPAHRNYFTFKKVRGLQEA